MTHFYHVLAHTRFSGYPSIVQVSLIEISGAYQKPPLTYMMSPSLLELKWYRRISDRHALRQDLSV